MNSQILDYLNQSNNGLLQRLATQGNNGKEYITEEGCIDLRNYCMANPITCIRSSPEIKRDFINICMEKMKTKRYLDGFLKVKDNI